MDCPRFSHIFCHSFLPQKSERYEYLNSSKVGIILIISKHLEHNDFKTTKIYLASFEKEEC